MPGRIYPCFALLGRGMLSWHVWEDRKVDLSGNVTCIGWRWVVFDFTFADGVR